MAISLAVIFGVLAVAGAVLIWGTVTKNRWGINLGEVSCPRCNAPLPKTRPPRSLRQRLWGGWTCPACGAEIDKWGRELPGPTDQLGGSRGDAQIPQRRQVSFFSRFGRSPLFWTLVLVLIALDIWSPRGIIFDLFAAIAFYAWHLKTRHA